jgi:hypothetical protein
VVGRQYDIAVAEQVVLPHSVAHPSELGIDMGDVLVVPGRLYVQVFLRIPRRKEVRGLGHGFPVVAEDIDKLGSRAVRSVRRKEMEIGQKWLTGLTQNVGYAPDDILYEKIGLIMRKKGNPSGIKPLELPLAGLDRNQRFDFVSQGQE